MPGTAGGAEGVRQIFGMLWSALPDMRVEIHDQVAEGDKVVTRKSFVGTHSGELFGVPATDKEVHLDLLDIVRVSDGKIVEHWNIVDSYGLMQQLGRSLRRYRSGSSPDRGRPSRRPVLAFR